MTPAVSKKASGPASSRSEPFHDHAGWNIRKLFEAVVFRRLTSVMLVSRPNGDKGRAAWRGRIDRRLAMRREPENRVPGSRFALSPTRSGSAD